MLIQKSKECELHVWSYSRAPFYMIKMAWIISAKHTLQLKSKAFVVQVYTLVKINIDNSKKHLHSACIFVFNTKIKVLAVTYALGDLM